jgi:hypothetical protein
MPITHCLYQYDSILYARPCPAANEASFYLLEHAGAAMWLQSLIVIAAVTGAAAVAAAVVVTTTLLLLPVCCVLPLQLLLLLPCRSIYYMKQYIASLAMLLLSHNHYAA